jgi:hypothetical protein
VESVSKNWDQVQSLTKSGIDLLLLDLCGGQATKPEATYGSYLLNSTNLENLVEDISGFQARVLGAQSTYQCICAGQTILEADQVLFIVIHITPKFSSFALERTLACFQPGNLLIVCSLLFLQEFELFVQFLLFRF